MSRVYNVIDADGHILEPLDLWARYMDPKFRDRAPRLVKDNASGIACGHTSTASIPAGRSAA